MKTHLLKPAILIIFLIASLSKTWSQPANDICETATVITGVISDQAFVTIEGTTLGALPEDFNNECLIGDFPTVWFRIYQDGNATLMNVQVTSNDFDAPTITVFHAIPDCDNFVQIPLTQSNLTCIIGSCGLAEAIASDIGSSEIYYIAVSSLNSVGGVFELSVNTISIASACVVSRDIEIVSRSETGPLTGPFFPGETVGVCMNVNSYTASGNGCQWFQGLVPVFGNGWDPSSFDANGQPLNATVNGNAMGVAGNGMYGASTFDWFTDVGYHHTNIFHQVGDIDGNGTVDMCNILYDPSCPNFGGLNGGCCGPCWSDAGHILPPGWFSYGINGSCGTPGPPIAVDWGDGNTCGCCMGPWNFCFELTIRNFPGCAQDCSTEDLSLGFFTFADGEVGSWTGGASICALDQPAKISLPMCCIPLSVDSEVLDTICNGQALGYIIDQPGVAYWQWTVDAGSVTGANEGAGGPATVINDTLINPGTEPETVTYTFLGFTGVCPVFELEVTVVVGMGPPIDIMFDPLPACTDTTPFTITANVTGGEGNYAYLWSPGGESTPSIIVQNPLNGSLFTVTVTDTGGCFKSASVTISLNSLPVEINATVVEQCQQNGQITLEGTAFAGIEPYNFDWTLPDGSSLSGDSISAGIPGLYLLEVTDSHGCIGLDSITLSFFNAPEVSIDDMITDTSICAGDTLFVSASAIGGQPPYLFIWSTPSGPDTAQNIAATAEGLYVVFVEDSNGCFDSSVVFLFVNNLPQVDLGPDSITVLSEIILDAGNAGSVFLWNTGETTQTITVMTPGTYSVLVTDNHGCSGIDSIYVDIMTDIIHLSETDHIRIFPNPNQGIFILTAELKTAEELRIEVTNRIGQTIFKSASEMISGKYSKKINLRASPGVYIIQIDLGVKRYVSKIVIE